LVRRTAQGAQMYFLLGVVSTISIVVLVAGPKLMDFEDDFGE